MFLKTFYDERLAHASYMVGCQRTKEAVVIDPGRDIEPYLEMAAKEGVKVTAAAETHIHADFVSGARELADRIDAKLYVSDEGSAEWKYQYLENYQHQLLREGDEFHIGKIRFDVLHTPGHTPESLSFVLTDQGGGADEPMGIFTGDFVFVGSIGRPDLLEEAAGLENTAEPGARELFRSAERFKQLSDYLQVWPAHGAGSACGKGLGAIPSSTVGYEKRFNPALQFTDEEEFVQYILADQPEAPKYFAVMKRVNKQGPQLIGEQTSPRRHSPAELQEALDQGTVVDLASAANFSHGHVPGSLNIPLEMLAGWAGWLLDYSLPVYLIVDQCSEKFGCLSEAVRVLQKIGVDRVEGVFHREALLATNQTNETYSTSTSQELVERIQSQQVGLLDVRSKSEWQTDHIAQARHVFLGKLPQQLHGVPKDRTWVLQCQSGGRSAIAASLLQAAGYHVINLAGGLTAWKAAGLPVVPGSE